MLHEIIKDNVCRFHIVGANFSDPCERYAAAQLQHYIYKSTGVFIPYFSDRCPKRSAEIIIGVNTRSAKNHIPSSEIDALGEEGCLIRTAGEDIIITGKTSRGTLYGVYEFLERFLGFCAYTKEVEKIDSLSELILPELNIKVIPDFEYRDAYFRHAFDGEFAAKCRFNSTLADLSCEKGGNLKFYNCHHSADDLVQPKLYFDTHPEYFALVNGKRTPDQLCLSNPEVVRIALDTVKSWIKDNPDCRVFSVAQNDNENYCRCENCRAIDETEGSPAGSNITFVNKIAAEIAKTHPDLLIHTFAYQYTRIAPKTVKPMPNVIVRLCNIECEWGDNIESIAKAKPESKTAEFLNNIKEWSEICDRLYIWDYAVNFSHYLMPFPNFKTSAENLKIYKKYNIRGMLQQGNFSYGASPCMDDLKIYLYSRLMRDTSLNVDVLIKEFTDAVYGSAGKYMKEYVDLWCNTARGEYVHLYEQPDASYITDELIEKSEELFKKALSAAETDEIRKRIEYEYLSIDFLKTVRIEDDALRAAETDRFAKRVRAAGITEIMERIHLELSFEMMKDNRYASDRSKGYRMYYIVR